jgi:hypothetical protein
MTSRFPAHLRNEPTRVAFGLTLIGLAIWLAIAFAVVPGLIADAWHGRGIDKLNRFFASRSTRKPLDHYQDLWRNFRNAVVLGAVAYGILLAIVRNAIRSVSLQWFLVLFSALFLAMTILWGPRQDYVAHLEIWRRVVEGSDPWWIQPESGIVLNAYGPLFELLSWPAAWNPLAPKIVFSASYLTYCIWIIRSYANDAATSAIETKMLAVWLANPFFWIEIAFYGHFDVLVALSVVAALVAFDRHEFGATGFYLGLGFLLKFLPAAFVPFLAIERKRRLVVHWPAAIAAVGTILGGMAGAGATWGDSVFRPLAFAAGRGSSLLSVWRYLKGPHSPMVWLGWPPRNLDALATPVLIAMLAVVFGLHLAKRFSPVHSCLTAALTIVIFYRVGFVQYQIVPFLILPIWYAKFREAIAPRRGLVLAVAAYVGWIVAFDLFDNAVGGIVGFDRPYAWLEDWVGLPTFLLGMVLWAALVGMPGGSHREPDAPNACPRGQDAGDTATK